jgi:hypothetical protein
MKTAQKIKTAMMQTTFLRDLGREMASAPRKT